MHVALESNKAKIIFKYIVHNLTTNNVTAKAECVMVLVNKNNYKPLKPDSFFEKFNHDAKSK